MTWTKKFKKSIDCSNPKGFSQKAHCRARKLRQMGKTTKSHPVNEDLRKWFREKWVNLAKKKKGGGYEPCGTSGEKKDMRNVFLRQKQLVCLINKLNQQFKENELHKQPQDVQEKNNQGKAINLSMSKQ